MSLSSGCGPELNSISLTLFFCFQMPSSESKEELETLLNMEMKLRLLDLENISIPETPPAIPVEPPDFNFVYDFS